MKLKLSDNSIIAILIVALVVQVAVLLWHLGIIQIGTHPQDVSRSALAGQIEKVENSLKRRPLDSLIWEDSQKKENIYYHDSILTLGQSTAQLKLENGTQIQLSENTLITIEPPRDKHSNEIRIQFSQGNLKARNPYQSATIKDKELTIHLKANSDIELYKNDEDKIEIQVNKGEAELIQADQKVSLNENEILRVSHEQSEKIQISQSLQWVAPPPLRQYTHSQEAEIPLQWQGDAKSVMVTSPHHPQKTVELKPGQQSVKIPLSIGEYRISIVNNGIVSQPLNFQVWKAPLIHLIEPQPRNRLNPGNVRFVWTANKEMKSYNVRVLSSTSHQDYPVVDNTAETPMENEGDFRWGVWGEDQEGFMVPPAYHYPVFIRQELFDAPQLFKPQIIKPKKEDPTLPPPSALRILQQWILPSAWAAKPEELVALFTWQDLPGAEIYNVEIAESKDFRKTVLQVQVEKSQFLWRGLDASKKYYWRVAAGNRSGRMGRFTEPTLVEMIEAKEAEALVAETKPEPPAPPPVAPPIKPVIKKKAAVVVKPENKPELPPEPVKEIVPQKPVVKKEVAPPKRVLAEEVPAPPPQRKEEKRKDRSKIWWQPGISSKQFNSPQETVASFSGLQIQSAGLQLNLDVNDKNQIRMIVQYASTDYEPTPKDKYPLQKNQSLISANARFFWKPAQSMWGGGVQAMLLPKIQRKTVSEIESSSATIYGGFLAIDTQLSVVDFLTTLSALTGDGQVGFQFSQRLIINLMWNSFIGLEGQLTQLSSDAHKVTTTDGVLLFGFGF